MQSPMQLNKKNTRIITDEIWKLQIPSITQKLKENIINFDLQNKKFAWAFMTRTHVNRYVRFVHITRL